MDIKADLRFHGPHLPTTVRQGLEESKVEIESAINDFVAAADALRETLGAESIERAWDSSRLAWGLVLPQRRHFLKSRRHIVERFRDGVEELYSFLVSTAPTGDKRQARLIESLARRRSLLNALLSPDSEVRIRELLAGERPVTGQMSALP